MNKKFKVLVGLASALIMALSLNITSFAQALQITDSPTYKITIGNTTKEIKEGEHLQVPMQKINNGFHVDEVFTGDAGTLTIYASGGRVYWDIALVVPATSFVGTINTMDLTSGFSGGYTSVYTFSGSIATSNYSGHLYSASINGTAYFLTDPVAKTMPNYIVWKA